MEQPEHRISGALVIGLDCMYILHACFKLTIIQRKTSKWPIFIEANNVSCSILHI